MNNAKKTVIGKTDCGRYLFAIYSRVGFHYYRLLPRTEYFRRMIRRAARQFKAEIPVRIDWDNLPTENYVVKLVHEDARDQK